MNNYDEYEFYKTLIKGIKVGFIGIGVLGFVAGTTFGIFVSDKEIFKQTCKKVNELKKLAKKTTPLMKTNKQGERNE